MSLRFGSLLLLPLVIHAQALPEKLTGRVVIAGISFAEGPAFDANGSLYFVNYRHKGSIGRMKVGEQPDVWAELPNGANAFGLKADGAGNIYAADFDTRKLFRVSPAGQVAIVADSYRGKPFNGLNDLCFDRAGNLYFTDPGGSTKDRPVGAVYRRSATDATLTQLAGQIAFPNGIAVDPDQTKLYVSDTGTNSILVWDLAANGAVAKRRTLYRFPDASVDGISFDDAGRLWVARLDHASLDVLAKDGRFLKSYPVTSAGKVTNMAWWGHELYVTTSVENVIRRFELPFGGAPAVPETGRPALERTGEGGMGQVFKARDNLLGRFVAIKLLPEARQADADHRARFVREAKAASALNLPTSSLSMGLASRTGRPLLPWSWSMASR